MLKSNNVFIFTVFTIIKYSESYIESRSCRTPLGEKSECVKLPTCNPMVDFLNKAPKPFPDEVSKTFNLFVCENGEDILDTLICCPSQSIDVDDEWNIVGPVPPPPNVTNHKNLKYLPEECGLINIDNKIYGGTNAGLREFPWMAVLLYRGEQLIPECGGTILNDRYILTAAHCLVDTPLPFAGVRVGEYSLLSEEDCIEEEYMPKRCIPPVQHLLAERIIPHLDYDKNSKVNDIALLRVTKMNFAENVQPICLPIPEEIINQEYSNGMVTGWGYTDPKGTKADILQKISLKRKNISECAAVYKRIPQTKVSTNSYKRLCIGGKAARDSCNGDSGSPFQVAANYDDEDRFYQRGIVSLGHIECGTGGFPAIYTNVDYYLDWILDNINS